MPRIGRGPGELDSPIWRASVRDEVNAELAFHVEMRTREYIARGMSPEAARAAAVARFGDIAAVNHECRSIGEERDRDMRRTEYLDELVHDVRFAARQLVKAPAFALVAVLTLAVGVGATTSIFSALEAVMLRPYPYPRADRLTFVFTHYDLGDGAVSVGDYTELARRSTSLAALAAFQFRGVTLAGGDSPERVTAAYTTASAWSLYGVRPQAGRVYTAAEDAPGAGDVVVLSDALWRRSFGGADVLGHTVAIDGQPHSIIGIMPPEFDPTDSHEALWLPAAFLPGQLAQHDEHVLTVVARLRDGFTRLTAQRDVDRVANQLAAEFPKTNKGPTLRLQRYGRAIVGDYRTPLLVLMGAVCCVLLIACGNVANLLLARGAARTRELAVRRAIGAGRARIVRQLLTESLVLSLAATALGVFFAWLGVHGLVGAAPAGIPRLATAHVDLTALAFALVLAAASSIVFGLVPAARGAQADLLSPLRDGSRTALAGTRDRVRAILVAAEVGLAVTVLIAAALLVRSAIYLTHVNPGFDPRGVLTARIAVSGGPDSARVARRTTKLGANQATAFFVQLVRALREQPGVAAVAVTSAAPLGGGGGINGVIPEGKEPSQANAVLSRRRLVSPGYLAAMGIPVLAGRDIGESDASGGLRVIVVSKALADAVWPNENPIGKRVMCCEGTPDDPRYKTVVGVAADVHTGGPMQEVRPEFYIPLVQAPPDAWRWIEGTMTVVLRTRSGDPLALAPMVRTVAHGINASVPVSSVGTMDGWIRESMAQNRFQVLLMTTLAGVALLLAAVGIYSVIAYFVALRRHEIGVRIALGATPADVVRLLTIGGLRPVLVGAPAGAIAAAWATRLLRGSLHGVANTDPASFVTVFAAVMVVALVAILIPARRATTVDPTTVLHG